MLKCHLQTNSHIRFFNRMLVRFMVNTEMKNHMLYKQNCKGDLTFDTEAHVKWGLAWQAIRKVSM